MIMRGERGRGYGRRGGEGGVIMRGERGRGYGRRGGERGVIMRERGVGDMEGEGDKQLPHTSSLNPASRDDSVDQ